MTTPYLIVGRYRSGSNALALGTAKHPRIEMRGELLNPSRLASEPEHLLRPCGVVADALAPNDTYAAVGFKLMYEQATAAELDPASWGPNLPERLAKDLHSIREGIAATGGTIEAHFAEVWRLLSDIPSLHIVHVRRRNQLASYVSLQLAMIEDNWLRKPYQSESITLDPDLCRAWCEHGLALDVRYRELFKNRPSVTVDHDDLTTEYESTIRRVHAFLSVEPVRVEPPIRRQQRRPIEEVVANYDQIRHIETLTLPSL